jgi:hypothetical protein
MCVDVRSLAAVLSGFAVRPTTHRVSNPPMSRAAASRRVSLGYVLKPDYTAPAMADVAAWVGLKARAHDAADAEGSLGSRAEALPSDMPRAVPSVGVVGRVGWQNKAMQSEHLSRLEAVSSFKAWKVDTFKHLRAAAAAAEAKSPC